MQRANKSKYWLAFLVNIYLACIEEHLLPKGGLLKWVFGHGGIEFCRIISQSRTFSTCSSQIPQRKKQL